MLPPLPEGYVSLPREEKLALLWSRLSEAPYPLEALPTRAPGTFARLKLFSVAHNRGSFEHVSDELPPDRVKLVHRYGTVAQVRVEVTAPTRFTGVFAQGGQGLLRMSDATGGGRLTPSLALKLPVDGRASLNFFGLPAASRATGDRDFLSGAFANSTPGATTLDAKLVARAFQKTVDALGGTRLYPVYLPLHHLAGMKLDGTGVDRPVVPDRVELHPTPEARAAFDRTVEWRAAFARLPEGLRLFELRISGALGEPAEPWGALVIERGFVASPYGDERLFFQHEVGPTQS